MQYSDGGRRALQGTWQLRVLNAASYAGCSLDHPLYRLQAQQTRIGAYELAFLDCLDGPRLVSVDSHRWTGRIGESIHFHVRDSVRVLQVQVMIREDQMSKTVLEYGHACQSMLDATIWIYTTQTEILQVPGLCMDVLAKDLPGNIGVDSVVFDCE